MSQNKVWTQSDSYAHYNTLNSLHPHVTYTEYLHMLWHNCLKKK